MLLKSIGNHILTSKIPTTKLFKEPYIHYAMYPKNNQMPEIKYFIPFSRYNKMLKIQS